jgi:hypothetical protein
MYTLTDLSTSLDFRNILLPSQTKKELEMLQLGSVQEGQTYYNQITGHSFIRLTDDPTRQGIEYKFLGFRR